MEEIMTTFEQAYLHSEALLVIGDMFANLVAIIFAVLVAGYIIGPRISRGLLILMLVVYTTFVAIMTRIITAQVLLAEGIAEAIPADDPTLPWLTAIAHQGEGPIPMAWLLGSIFALTYIASIIFILQTSRREIMEGK
jgi:hypothetical protein